MVELRLELDLGILNGTVRSDLRRGHHRFLPDLLGSCLCFEVEHPECRIQKDHRPVRERHHPDDVRVADAGRPAVVGALTVGAVHRALERVHRGAHAASAHVGRAQPIERGAVSEHPGRQFLHRSIGRR